MMPYSPTFKPVAADSNTGVNIMTSHPAWVTPDLNVPTPPSTRPIPVVHTVDSRYIFTNILEFSSLNPRHESIGEGSVGLCIFIDDLNELGLDLTLKSMSFNILIQLLELRLPDNDSLHVLKGGLLGVLSGHS